MSPTSLLRSIRAISAVESMEVGGVYHVARGPDSCVSSVTWMSAWQHSVVVKLGTRVGSWVDRKGEGNRREGERL